MKKCLRVVVCLVLALGIFMCLGGCGSDTEPKTGNTPSIKENAVGRYELKKVQWANGTAVSGDALKTVEDQMGDMYVELFRDGTATLALYGQVQDMEFSEDKMWQENFSLVTYDFSVSDGKVILNRNGDEYIFEKK